MRRWPIAQQQRRPTPAMSMPCRGELCPSPETGHECGHRQRQPNSDPQRIVTHSARCLEHNEDRAVEQGSPQVARPPSSVYAFSTSVTDGYLVLGVDRKAADQDGERHPPQHRRQPGPAAIPKSAQLRHFGSSTLPRHSMDTTRTIMPNKIASNGIQRQNTVAYMPGKAANIVPPACSHTSLPPHRTDGVEYRPAARLPVAAAHPGYRLISMPTPNRSP